MTPVPASTAAEPDVQSMVAADLPAEVRGPEHADTPMFAAMQDPLSGPLREPLLAPLLDPTIHEDDPLGLDATRPAAPDTTVDTSRPPPPEDSWANDWESGAWAMSASALTEPDDVAEDPDAETAEDESAPSPRRRAVARHRFADDTEVHDAPDPMRDEDPIPDAATPAAEPESRQRPGLAARLSDSDRQLLARLQAEFEQGRRPRVSRRAGVASSTTDSAGTNPQRQIDPPDLAG